MGKIKIERRKREMPFVEESSLPNLKKPDEQLKGEKFTGGKPDQGHFFSNILVSSPNHDLSEATEQSLAPPTVNVNDLKSEDKNYDIAPSANGRSIPFRLRQKFEKSLRTDLQDVQIHNDSQSEEVAKLFGAKAYTLGQHIYFRNRYYSPESIEGERLLAHEVFHTQQSSHYSQSPVVLGSPHDINEQHADNATESMITGKTATSMPLTSGEQGVVRLKEDKNTIVKPVTLLQAVEEDRQERVQAKNEQYSWGSSSIQTRNEKGEVVDNEFNPVVANAKERGTLEMLKAVSEELDVIKPSLMSWQSADASVSSIQSNTGIDPNSPEKYSDDFERLHIGMQNTKDEAVKEMRARLDAARQGKLRQAESKLRAAMSRLEKVKTDILERKNRLEQMKADKELKDNAEELKKINEAIKDCVSAVTTIGKVIAVVAGGISAIEAGASGVSLAAEGTGAAVAVKSDPYLPKAVGSGGEKVEKSGDVLTKFFEYTLFKEELEKCKVTTKAINDRISSLKANSAELMLKSAENDFSTATEELEAAKIDAAEARDAFMTNLLAAGRTWDQRDLTKEEAGKRPISPTPNRPGETSMEGLFGMYAAMVQRGAARENFKLTTDRCPHVQPDVADRVIATILASSKAAPNSSVAVAIAPIDHPQVREGAEGATTKMISDDFRNGVVLVSKHIEYYSKNAKNDKALEDKWVEQVKQATGKAV